jgi:hypothetical protein
LSGTINCPSGVGLYANAFASAFARKVERGQVDEQGCRRILVFVVVFTREQKTGEHEQIEKSFHNGLIIIDE